VTGGTKCHRHELNAQEHKLTMQKIELELSLHWTGNQVQSITQCSKQKTSLTGYQFSTTANSHQSRPEEFDSKSCLDTQNNTSLYQLSLVEQFNFFGESIGLSFSL
jgi:hypothetical protein